jgi:hypothetical protein
MLFADQLTLDAPRRTQDGYLAVRAKAARTGVYQYAGHEVDPDNKHGLRDSGLVHVLRDDAAVFDSKSAHSFIGKPVTDNHPSVAVNAANWRDHARGVVMGAMRDGEYLAFDLLLTDASAIAAVNGGKRELSNGYAADLEFGDFTAADGTKCVARQKSITGNHVAIVDRGRAGPSCRIGDAAICDALPIALQDGAKEAAAWLKKAIALHEKHMNGSAPTTGKEGEKSQMLMMEQMKNALSELESDPSEKPMKMDALVYGENTMKIKIGDAEVDATNGEAVRIAVDALNVKLGGLTADNATLKTSLETKDGEIAALNAKLKDAEVTPEKLQALADARAKVIASAQSLKPGITVDGKTDAEIRKEAVTAKLGDATKDMADAAIEGAFVALTKDATPSDPLRNVLKDGLSAPADARSVVSTIRNARYA